MNKARFIIGSWAIIFCLFSFIALIQNWASTTTTTLGHIANVIALLLIAVFFVFILWLYNYLSTRKSND